MYVLSPSVLNRVEMRPTSIEKEVFPHIASDGKLFAMVLPGYWMDVGQPKDYLTGLHLYLNGLREKRSTQLATGDAFEGNVLVHETATIGEGCVIGPNVCIGPGCRIEDGVRLKVRPHARGCTHPPTHTPPDTHAHAQPPPSFSFPLPLSFSLSFFLSYFFRTA